MSNLIPLFLRANEIDDDGDMAPVTDATAFIFEEGSSTPLIVYEDAGLTTPRGTSVAADANGIFPLCYTDKSAVKIDIRDGSGTSLDGYPIDGYPTFADSDNAASSISATPQTGNAGTTVAAQLNNNTARGNTLENAAGLPTASGSMGSYAIASPYTITAYAVRQEYEFIANHTNVGGGSDTLNVDAVGAVTLKKYEGSTTKGDLAAGDIVAGDKVRVKYDGTHFVVVSPLTAGEDTKGIAEIATSAEISAGTAKKLVDAAGLSTALSTAGLQSLQVFTASGTWTKPAGITKVLMFVTGGGNDGDGSDYGGAGGTAIKFLDVTSIASSTITVGAGTGTDSSWDDGTNTITGTGGGGGNGNSNGGVPTGGDLNITGGSGNSSGSGTGAGGASFWGGGRTSTNSPVAYGAGGYNANAGGGGVVFVLEFT